MTGDEVRAWLPWLALALALVAAGAWGALAARRRWRGWQLQRRMRRARRGEASAEGWLARHGFAVLDRQVTRQATLLVDGVPTPFTVRADYVVERDGVRAVVEVKSGAVARPEARETRRQILEYAWVFDVREVHLFDAEAQTLRRIGVARAPRDARAVRWAWWIVAAFLAGVAAGLLAAWQFAR